jgi:proline-serine-threonine phosphatase interacting protein 1
MTRENHYSDAFWEAEFCGTSGFDTLLKHMRDGRESCKYLAGFIRQRAKIEEEYAKAIEKANKTADFSLEIGTLRRSADQLKSSTDKVAQEHFVASKEFTEYAQTLDDFTSDQKKASQKEKGLMQKAILNKSQAYSKAMDAKKKYNQKSQDHENAECVRAAAQASRNNMPTNKWQKITKDVTRSAEAAKVADGAYRESIQNLDDERDKWERQMCQFAVFSEEQDVTRACTMHTEMWKICNAVCTTCAKTNQCCEEVRKSLELVDVTADLQQFIDTASTGSEKPAAIKFEPFGSSTAVKAADSLATPPSTPKADQSDSFNTSIFPLLSSRQPVTASSGTLTCRLKSSSKLQ